MKYGLCRLGFRDICMDVSSAALNTPHATSDTAVLTYAVHAVCQFISEENFTLHGVISPYDIVC